MAFKNLGKRVGVGIIGAPLVLGLVWLGDWYYALLITLIAALATFEFDDMLKAKGILANRLITIGFIPLFYAIIYLQKLWLVIPLLVLAVFLLIFKELFSPSGSALQNISGGLLAIIYIPFLYSFWLDIRYLPSRHGMSEWVGAELVFLILIAIWICDSAAYFVGSRIGKHKLAPVVSPNKTIEGGLGGVFGAILASVVCQLIFATSLTLAQAIVIGGIIGVFGQLSDLVESLFKRDAGVKDSSSLLPGHGGILDRFDSELLAVPVIYAYLLFVVFN